MLDGWTIKEEMSFIAESSRTVRAATLVAGDQLPGKLLDGEGMIEKTETVERVTGGRSARGTSKGVNCGGKAEVKPPRGVGAGATPGGVSQGCR